MALPTSRTLFRLLFIRSFLLSFLTKKMKMRKKIEKESIVRDHFDRRHWKFLENVKRNCGYALLQTCQKSKPLSKESNRKKSFFDLYLMANQVFVSDRKNAAMIPSRKIYSKAAQNRETFSNGKKIRVALFWEQESLKKSVISSQCNARPPPLEVNL